MIISGLYVDCILGRWLWVGYAIVTCSVWYYITDRPKFLRCKVQEDVPSSIPLRFLECHVFVGGSISLVREEPGIVHLTNSDSVD